MPVRVFNPKHLSETMAACALSFPLPVGESADPFIRDRVLPPFRHFRLSSELCRIDVTAQFNIYQTSLLKPKVKSF